MEKVTVGLVLLDRMVGPLPGQVVLQLHSDLVGGNGLEGIQEIFAFKADLQLIAVTGNRAGIMGCTNGIGGMEIRHLITEDTTNRTLDLLGYDEAHTLN